MADEFQTTPEEAQEPQDQGCDPERIAMALDIIEKGTKQAFLNGELDIDETKSILDHIELAKEACESGDQNACSALKDLVNDLTKDE